MDFKFLNKKSIFFLVLIIVLITIVGGIFWWKQPGSQLKKWWIEETEMGGSIRDFSIRETSDGRIIENNKEGLRVKVIKGWKTEKTETAFFSEWGVNILSPDIEFDDNHILRSGCIISINILKGNMPLDLMTARIQSIEETGEIPTLEEDLYEIIRVDEMEALKELMYDDPRVGVVIEVTIPTRDEKNIWLVLGSSFNDKEKCLQKFNEFLATVEIKK